MGQIMTNITNIGFKESFEDAEKQRKSIDFDSLCTYGIKPLDDAMGGINKNELVVVGADSGAGKSELSLSIMNHNIERGKKVGMFYLEGGHREAMYRMIWKELYRRYTKQKIGFSDITYVDWINNKIKDPLLDRILEEIKTEYDEKYKDKFYIASISKDFTLSDLTVSLWDFHNLETRDAKLDLDLIIIDHLQYFSLLEGESEISSITKILREVKNITNIYSIPIILVSHLRKKMKDRGLPSQEDFYGSSNIPKIASTCITISPLYAEADFAQGIYPTFFRIVKSRVGVPPSLAMLTDFNLKRREYADEYSVYKINNATNTPAKHPLSYLELPTWARKGAKRAVSQDDD